MTAFDYDLFVIGAGSGGVRAARIAASHGAKVAVAEEYRVGGTCVIRGCVPKKLLVYASQFASSSALSDAYGWSGPRPQLDWPRLRDAVEAEVARLSGLYTQTLANNGVTLIEGRAVLEDAHTLDLGDRKVTARHILIATGARPVLPDAPGASLGITSNEVFRLPALPKRILIAGGGYIATEFAGIFHGLGSQVTQLYRGETILKGWDDELRGRLQQSMVDRGITLHTRAIFDRIEKQGDALRACLSDGAVIEAEVILHAIGRKPNTDGLGLEKAGVALSAHGAVKVDDWSQTSVPHIHAVGDVTDRLQLTPVAIKEGHGFADSVFGSRAWHADWSHVPSAVFSQPALAGVGLTETAAVEAGHDVKVYRSAFRPMKTAMAGLPDQSICKLIVDAKTDRVLGAHMLGEEAPEIIQALAIAVKMGVTKAQFDQTVAVHPTAAEEFVLMR
jgi:glutathione reductase (NADPH)